MHGMNSDKLFLLGSDAHFYQSFCGKLELKTYKTSQIYEEMNVTPKRIAQEFNVPRPKYSDCKVVLSSLTRLFPVCHEQFQWR